MKCPKCNGERSSVVDSRNDGQAIRRRRECQECQFRFSTFERIEYTFPMIIKKDGRRENFLRDKLKSGVQRACEKRPVSVEAVDQLIERVERKLHEKCAKELPSLELGDLVMDELRELDGIAYVRFASVYREFSDVHQFVDTLQSLRPVEDLAVMGKKAQI